MFNFEKPMPPAESAENKEKKIGPDVKKAQELLAKGNPVKAFDTLQHSAAQVMSKKI